MIKCELSIYIVLIISYIIHRNVATKVHLRMMRNIQLLLQNIILDNATYLYFLNVD